MRLKRPPKDDPRLSRGLQLLQSKITVLEDLSTRTDKQFEQLTSLLDQKSRMLQSKIFESENQIQKIKNSMSKSLEIAEIFQDKIPHDEIIERKNTTKFVMAAQLAHSGRTAEDIAREIDLPIEQIELIAKVNRDQLVFDQENLPAWAQKNDNSVCLDGEDSSELNLGHTGEDGFDPQNFQLPEQDFDSLKRLGKEFRNACETFEDSTSENHQSSKSVESRIVNAAKRATEKVVQGVESFVSEPFLQQEMESDNKSSQKKSQEPQIQRVVFPRVDLGE